jgi:hypothetical protein
MVFWLIVIQGGRCKCPLEQARSEKRNKREDLGVLFRMSRRGRKARHGVPGGRRLLCTALLLECFWERLWLWGTEWAQQGWEESYISNYSSKWGATVHHSSSNAQLAIRQKICWHIKQHGNVALTSSRRPIGLRHCDAALQQRHETTHFFTALSNPTIQLPNTELPITFVHECYFTYEHCPLSCNEFPDR